MSTLGIKTFINRQSRSHAEASRPEVSHLRQIAIFLIDFHVSIAIVSQKMANYCKLLKMLDWWTLGPLLALIKLPHTSVGARPWLQQSPT